MKNKTIKFIFELKKSIKFLIHFIRNFWKQLGTNIVYNFTKQCKHVNIGTQESG